MARFIVRVEIDNAGPAIYGRLHSAMSMRGFSNVISAADGLVYHLPCAEYYREGRFTVQQVLVEARSAVTAVSNSCSILVSETTNCTWEGLKADSYATTA